jgi:hypothetical protein
MDKMDPPSSDFGAARRMWNGQCKNRFEGIRKWRCHQQI